MRWIVLALALFFGGLEAAQVKAVLFYAPSCQHCHDVLEQEIAPLLERYPDQLELLLVNIATVEGSDLYDSAVVAFHISDDNQGIPTLIVGKDVLVGAIEIPEKFELILKEGLASGGISLPAIPGLAKDAPDLLLVETEADLEKVETVTVAQKLAKDPLGNGIAIGILALMLVSLIIISCAYIRHGFPQRGTKITYLMPILALCGMGIAIYLSYIEVSGDEAVCGFIGHCDEVQQSPYSWLFGLIPVGILGSIGYLVIALMWGVYQFGKPHNWATKALPIFLIVSVIIACYLTFLEPFVIGAVCMWCLISALIMTALLWLAHPRIGS